MSHMIFEQLRKDHDIQRELIQVLADTSGDTQERQEIFKKLKDQLESHAESEERFFYAPLMQYDAAMEKARHSVAEHKELDDLVEEIASTEPSSPAYLRHVKNLRERLLHHLEEEEKEVFVSAGHALNTKQKQELGEKYKADIEKRLNYQETRT